MKKNLVVLERIFAALLLAAATSTVHAAPADKTGRVWGIKVSENEGDTAITIAASQKPTFTTWKLERPARVVIDISGARLGDLEVPFDAGTYAVGSVSASTSDDDSGARTRVVLTLRQAADYKVESHGNDIVVRVLPHTRPMPALARNNDAEARKLAEERARSEEARKKAEAAKLQAQSEQQKAETAKQQAQSAQAEVQAAHKQLAEERAKIEEARKQSRAAEQQALTAQQKSDEKQAERDKAQAAAARAAELAAQKLAQEKADLEARRQQAEAATRAADTARKALASATAESEKARRDAEQAQRAAKGEREKADLALREAVAAQKKMEERASRAGQANAEKAKEQLEAARRETERARAVATRAADDMERARREKTALEAARSDVEKQRQALARSEVELKKTQREAEESRKRAEAAERQAETARLREEERGSAVKVAAAQVEARRKALESKSASQEEQRQELARAERLVSERDVRVKAAAAELAAREKAVSAAQAKQAALEKSGASEEARKTAAGEAAQARKEREEAVAAAGRSRQELAEAVEARRKEEGRKAQLESERVAEERKLREAVAARTGEEARRQSAEEGRRQEEARLSELRATRAKAEAERAKLEAEREALVAELDHLKRPAPVAMAKAPAPAKLPAPAPAKAPAAVAVPARPVMVAAVPVKVVEPVAAPAPRPRSITLRVPSRVQRVDFVDEPTRSSVIIDLDEPSNFAIERTAGHKVTLRLLHADLPRGLERSLDATEYLGPVKVISTYRDPDGSGAVRVDVDLAEEVPNKVRQDGSRLYWDFQKQIVNIGRVVRGKFSAGYTFNPSLLISAQAAQALGTPAGGGNTFRPGGAAKKRYTGRRVDLDFKGADIHNILRLLSDVGQVNIVVADDVKGDVTIKMRDVPWDQALDVVLRGKQLGSVREGNLIRVAPLSVLEKELEQEIARQKQITDVLPTETRLIGVSYADAKNLQDRAKDLLSSRGKISVDDRTNNLIVSDVAKNLALIEELVRNLDTQTSQVVIEARIVEARSTFVRQMGVQWGGTGFADADHGNPTGLAFPYNIGVGGGATDGQTPTAGLVPNPRNGLSTANPNFAVNLPVAAGTGAGGALGLTLGSVAGAFNLNLRLTALESQGSVRILSSPRITTMDNIEASIQQGVAIPISVVSAQGVQTVFVDAILDLTVKPHVTNEGTVMLNINIRRNEPDFVNTGARGDPTILKKEAKTSMLIRDGDTAVIGGIYTRNSGLNYAKVPLFADIPILGVMFRNRRENDDRTEFLVFITPRIANRARALGQ